jgi:hypothetical protein
MNFIKHSQLPPMNILNTIYFILVQKIFKIIELKHIIHNPTINFYSQLPLVRKQRHLEKQQAKNVET